MTTPLLVVTCVLSAAAGPLDLEAGAYELEKGSFEEISVSWRKSEVENRWVEGTYLTSAVRAQVVRPLNVWVTGTTRASYKAAREALVTALEQLSYTLSFGIDGESTTWRCQVADYAIREQQEYLFGFTGLIRAQVPTFPTAIA